MPDGVVGFYKPILNCNAQGGEGTTHFLNNANKAYLVLPAPSGVAAYSFSFGDGATAVDGVFENVDAATGIYDLTGRRIEKAEKGIYIVNGKKLFIK